MTLISSVLPSSVVVVGAIRLADVVLQHLEGLVVSAGDT